MHQISIFLFKNKRFFLFLTLSIIGIALTVSTNTYHRYQFWHSASWLSGNIHNIQQNIGNYFQLKKENALLTADNTFLKEQLLNTTRANINPTQIDFTIIQGQTVKNSYNLTRNYITINIGNKTGVSQDMGVITNKGIVGIIDRVSSNFSRIQSILNSNSKISVQLKNTNHLGILEWDGTDPRYAQIADVPSLATININDTIVTSGNSLTFPRGLLVGVVKKFQLDDSQNYYKIQIELINDMTSLNAVYVIQNNDLEEINSLNSANE